jgi:hypothetical protein
MKVEIIIRNEKILKSSSRLFQLHTLKDILDVHPEVLSDILNIMEKEAESLDKEDINLSYIR